MIIFKRESIILPLLVLVNTSISINAAPLAKPKLGAETKVPANYQIKYFPAAVGVDGFDEASRWMMVPKNGKSTCHAFNDPTTGPSGGPHPDTLRWDFDKTKVDVAITRVDPTFARLTVSGKVKGDTQISPRGIVNGISKVLGKLDITVKEPKVKTVNFFYVQDASGDNTGRQMTNSQKIIDQLNVIYGKQVNVTFMLENKMEVRLVNQSNVAINLPNPVPLSDSNFDLIVNSISRLPDQPIPGEPPPLPLPPAPLPVADFNVLFVWKAGEYEEMQNGKKVKVTATGKANQPGTHCIVADQGNAVVVAHEIGHSFGLPHVQEADNLMLKSAVESHLVKAQINIVNPS